jgi:flagellar biosynthetic protein FliR
VVFVEIVDSLMDLSQDKLFLYFTTFLLVLARMIGFFVQAPIWGTKHIVNPVQVGVVVSFTLMVLPNVPVPHEIPGGPLTLMILIITQIFVGLVIGYISFLPMAMAQFGGEMMDNQMGLASAASYDPASKGTINLIRRLYFYLTMTFYLMMDGHHTLLKATAKSFEIIPLTGARFSYTLIEELYKITGQVLLVGLQIAMPVMGALLIVQVALGIMARVAPQMNVFMLSFPLNIMTGLTLITLSLPIFISRLPSMFDQSVQQIISALQHMIPK